MQNAVAKHYLWAIGEGIKACKPDELIAGRYLFKGERLLLDTKPDQLPEIPEEIPDVVVPYLRLFPARLYLPQIYGLISPSASRLTTELWLLENGPIDRRTGQLLPSLSQCWPGASAMRQLTWLWQIAQLWEPLRSQGVASSLLHPELLRVDGRLVRLLHLELDRKAVNLQFLGRLWQQWQPAAHPQIANFLQQLCQSLLKGQIRSADRLVDQLDHALLMAGQSQHRLVHIASGTDKGPSRSHNEDACYPVQGSSFTTSPGPDALGIVCDGIGGQEGGEVASQLAIDILSQQIQSLSIPPDQMNPLRLITELEDATCAANDAISRRNDWEQRQGRQRMGTTLVMGLAHDHEFYLTHVGDSRAYWITRQGCYQVTLDDDVACREVRLGYATYLDALQQVAAGALIQALGITSSMTLHPTVQRFPIDEDCVFLLCSDGLSDRERVSECWSSLILPILDQQVDVATVRDQLIQVANTKNGHDNVTVALMYFQVTEQEEVPEISVAPIPATEVPTILQEDDPVTETSPLFPSGENRNPSAQPSGGTRLIPRLPKGKSPWPPILGIMILLGLGWGVLGILAPEFLQGLIGPEPPLEPLPTASPELPASPQATPISSGVATLPLGSLFQLYPASGSPTEEELSLVLWKDVEQSAPEGKLPLGSVWQILEKQTRSDVMWLHLKLCKILPVDSLSEKPEDQVPGNDQQDSQNGTGAIESPQGFLPNPAPGNSQESPSPETPQSVLKPGTQGWISLEEISKGEISEERITPDLRGVCTS